MLISYAVTLKRVHVTGSPDYDWKINGAFLFQILSALLEYFMRGICFYSSRKTGKRWRVSVLIFKLHFTIIVINIAEICNF